MDPIESERFQTYFTILRSQKFWSGIWSYMFIEQTLMKSMATSDGFNRGRGIILYFFGLVDLHNIREGVRSFCVIASGPTNLSHGWKSWRNRLCLQLPRNLETYIYNVRMYLFLQRELPERPKIRVQEAMDPLTLYHLCSAKKPERELENISSIFQFFSIISYLRARHA